jgi:acetyl-CoA synthetase
MSKLTSRKASTEAKFAPPPTFVEEAHVTSPSLREALVQTSLAQPDAFWTELARALRFTRPFERVLDWKLPKAQWFVGGQLNVSENCLDRHLAKNGARTALLWEGEPGETRKVSYRELHAETCRIANALKAQGVKKGDRVLIYMPMVPETIATMQACARIGAVHTVVFGGFSAQAIADRLQDSQAKAVVTADGTWRKGKFLALKPIVDEALAKGGHDVNSVLVLRRDASQACPMHTGRDFSWEESVLSQSAECAPEPMDSEDPLFILYTSGTTGKPKGLYHTQAGYLLWAHWTTRWLFDLQDDDLYWCTADCGWITGHTYVAYGPLSNGASQFIYEGAPLHPGPDRFWDMIERHAISKLYTSPTAIRMFMGLGAEHAKKHDLSSLRLLGTVGEPINPEAWLWYHEHIGGKQCPIVDTYWQTETGGAMIAPYPGAVDTKPGSATFPLPGVEAEIRDPQTGQPLPAGQKGALVFKRPWPAMARGIWGDEARYEQSYWRASSATNGVYFTGDMASIDADGYVWVEGRMDDVLNVSGHRLGTAEIESALVAHADIYEAAAVGIPDAIKGQAVVVFVELTQAAQMAIREGHKSVEQIKAEAREQVGREIGSFAKPDQVRVARALPKTRSGKIMRRLLRELAATGEMKGDTTTLEDFSQDSLKDDGA